MKILMVISEAPPVKSGVARVAERLSQGLQHNGHQVDLLSLQDIPRYEFGEFRISTMPFKLPFMRKQIQAYDLINLHGPVPTFSDVFLLWGLRSLRSSRTPIVYTHHAPIQLYRSPLAPFVWLYNLFQERLTALADHVVATTPSYGQRLSRFVPIKKLSIIPWGVNPEYFVNSIHKNAPFTVVYLGQIRPYKGLPILLQASEGLKDLRLWVIGDGHAAPAYRDKARNLGLENLTFWGSLPDHQLIELLHQAHVIVLPSVTRSEAFGIALLEGMAAGLVPVASHLPGVADLIGNEGYTFPPKDANALREILIRLQTDSALRTYQAGLAQAKARLYSWKRVIFGYERIFKQLVPQSDANKPPTPVEIPTVPALRRIAGKQ